MIRDSDEPYQKPNTNAVQRTLKRGEANKGDVDRTVVKYYAFEVTRNAHLSGPIWVLFLLSRDVSYSGIGALDAAYSVTVLLAETPTGYVGDRLGRKWSLAFGVVGTSLASFWFAFAETLPGFLVAYVGLAVAQTFTSGTDSAWLYDTLRERTDEGQFATIRGRGRAIGLAVSALAAIAGGLTGQVNLAVPWLLSGALTAVGLPVVLSFPAPDYRSLDERRADDESPDEAGDDAAGDEQRSERDDDAAGDEQRNERDDDAASDEQRSERADDAASDEPRGDDAGNAEEPAGQDPTEPGSFAALVAARDQLLAPGLRGFVLYAGVFVGLLAVLNFFVQPVTLDAVPELPRIAGYQPTGVVVVGLVFAAFRLIAAGVTAKTGWISERLGTARWFRLAPFGVGVAFAAVGVFGALAVPVFFLLQTVRSVTRPLQAEYLNDRVTSLGRATTLSAVSMTHAVIGVPIELLGGALADRVGTIDALAVLGGVLVALACVAAFARRTRVGRLVPAE